jgi:hypothetical protein
LRISNLEIANLHTGGSRPAGGSRSAGGDGTAGLGGKGGFSPVSLKEELNCSSKKRKETIQFGIASGQRTAGRI